ncbi:MAG: nucleotidyltransferase domain-containing protein [Deltaproteobacteria bacterium]|nr:MAG: nucleotidyltransferase domain-containing protein [Deltaproteobacteria bacterium]
MYYRLKRNCHRTIIFGSYFKGLSHAWSDIDIALVSDAFDRVRIRDRCKIRHITLSASSDLAPIPFWTKDFTEKNPLVRKILETGVKVV